MNQLTHWNPFRTTGRGEMASGLDALLRDFGMRPLAGMPDAPDIRIDVSESDKAYSIKADIPGVRKEDIDVAVEGRQVSISAKARSKSEKKDETSIYTERSEGQAVRAFTLPVEVDEKRAEAKYENGVLSLVLPKKANGKNHRIKVG
jgi:HSP20 family protein